MRNYTYKEIELQQQTRLMDGPAININIKFTLHSAIDMDFLLEIHPNMSCVILTVTTWHHKTSQVDRNIHRSPLGHNRDTDSCFWFIQNLLMMMVNNTDVCMCPLGSSDNPYSKWTHSYENLKVTPIL